MELGNGFAVRLEVDFELLSSRLQKTWFVDI